MYILGGCKGVVRGSCAGVLVIFNGLLIKLLNILVFICFSDCVLCSV